MARLARAVVANLPHHVTQRGNARRSTLTTDGERRVYLHLLRYYVSLHGLSLLGYYLMSNHVHLVAIPHKGDGLAAALKQTHGRYAAYWNAAHESSGHPWQGRFYSCPLDDDHLWVCLRYAELNPVRAVLVARAELWRWSSAGVHCRAEANDGGLESEAWSKRWSAASRRDYLSSGESEAELRAIRKCTHTGRPLGSTEFVRAMEQATRRHLRALPDGCPRGSRKTRAQELFFF
jgi:putative transposase